MRPAYWARLEKHFFDLLESLPGDWDEASDDWKPDDQQVAAKDWRKHVKDEARQALEESIRSLGTTARAIQAVGAFAPTSMITTSSLSHTPQPRQEENPKEARNNDRWNA